ncbi:MAG: hypothetical protein ACLRSW_03460 [Christensenellaceae bacterium]
MTPVMWGGTVQEYMSSLLTAIAADNDGKEQTELNYNYEGVADTLVASLNGDTPVLGAAETINARNGYKLYRQEGRYYALKFLERLVSKPEYYNASDATNTAFAHTDAGRLSYVEVFEKPQTHGDAGRGKLVGGRGARHLPRYGGGTRRQGFYGAEAVRNAAFAQSYGG